MHFFKRLLALEAQGMLEQVEIAADPSLAFPASPLRLVAPLSFKVRFFGLYGASAVLPPFMNEIALSNTSEGESFRAFLDIFQRRLHLLKYQVWKQGYAAFFAQPGGQAYQRLLQALAGPRLSETQFSSLYGHGLAGFLGKKSVSAQHVAQICQLLTGFAATVQENSLQWRQLPKIAQPPRLGENSLLGKRYLENRRHLRIQIHCLSVAKLQALYQNHALCQNLHLLLQACLEPHMDPAIYLHAAEPGPAWRLNEGESRLGLGAVLGKALGSGAQLRLSSLCRG